MMSENASETTDYVINIVGERIVLGPLHRDHLPLYHRWRNDFWIQRTYGGALVPVTWEAQESWYNEQASSSDAMWFTIYERSTMRAIGLTDFFNIERDHGLAWWGMAIGESDCRGKGYASEAARLMLDYGFVALNLNVIVLSVDEFNIAARKAYARAGFKETGRIRGATYLSGRHYDRIMMDCVASEFESPLLRAELEPSGI